MFKLLGSAALLILVYAATLQAQDISKTIATANAAVLQLFINGKYAEGLELSLTTMARAEKELGLEHPDTLSSLHNLALLYNSQRRYEEAEPLYRRALEARERVLGPEHPDTLSSVSGLASLYSSQGRYGEAEPLYRRELETYERVLGQEHPITLSVLGNLAVLLTNMHKDKEALQSFRALDNGLAFWLNAEATSTQSAAVGRQILKEKSAYQELMFSFALAYPSDAAQRFAADLTLRWKLRPAQEAAHLANLVRTSKDSRIIDAARLVQERQNALDNAALKPSVPVLEKEALKQSLEAAEVELRRQSAEYSRFKEAKDASSQEVQDALPRDSALIEYRTFNSFNFKTGKFDKLHLLAVVLRPGDAPVLIDLGEAGPAYAAQPQLIDVREREKDSISEQKLRRVAHKHLIEPLTAHLKDIKTLIISPDGPLHALPFDALLDERGKALIEIYAVRMVQTGRDLVIRDRVATGKGFVGFGDIDFGGGNILDGTPAQTGTIKTARANLDEDLVRSLSMMGEQMPNGLPPLPVSGEEVDAIGKLYHDRRTAEPAPLIYKHREATEKALRALAAPPRVLHLATHGAYLKDAAIAGQPLLQSFVAMAGANNGMGGFSIDGENGILHAIEAQTLNLFGTELVVLSACQTGQGVFDYSEGLEGLLRAFNVAGAKNVLVTLWKVGEESTRAFMTEFYDRWTQQTTSDPAKALSETKKHFMAHPNPAWRQREVWAAFVLYEG